MVSDNCDKAHLLVGTVFSILFLRRRIKPFKDLKNDKIAFQTVINIRSKMEGIAYKKVLWVEKTNF